MLWQLREQMLATEAKRKLFALLHAEVGVFFTVKLYNFTVNMLQDTEAIRVCVP